MKFFLYWFVGFLEYKTKPERKALVWHHRSKQNSKWCMAQGCIAIRRCQRHGKKGVAFMRSVSQPDFLLITSCKGRSRHEITPFCWKWRRKKKVVQHLAQLHPVMQSTGEYKSCCKIRKTIQQTFNLEGWRISCASRWSWFSRCVPLFLPITPTNHHFSPAVVSWPRCPVRQRKAWMDRITPIYWDPFGQKILAITDY